MPNRDDAALCATLLSDQWFSYFQFIAHSYAVPSRFDVDDCIQECCLELSMLMDEMDPTDPNFSSVLKHRVYHRLIDMARAEKYASRDVRRTVPLGDEADENSPAFSLTAEFEEPSAVAVAGEMESIIGEQLTSHETIVWRELVRPSRSLGSCFTAYRRKRGRNELNVPHSVYAEATGLSVRQVRHALEGIRNVARQVFSTEGELSCLF